MSNNNKVRGTNCFLSRKINLKLTTSLFILAAGIFLLPKTAYLSGVSPEKIIELTNQERQIAGLTILTPNLLLNKAALKKANDIILTQNFVHTINSKKFSEWIKEAGYNYVSAGENLAIDFTSSEKIISAWLDSETHRANILNKGYKEIGVASVEGKYKNENTIIVVQIFGNPVKAINAVTKNSIIKKKTFPLVKGEVEYKKNIFQSQAIKEASKLTAADKINDFSPDSGLKLLAKDDGAIFNNGLIYFSANLGSEPLSIDEKIITDINKGNNFFIQSNSIILDPTQQVIRTIWLIITLEIILFFIIIFPLNKTSEIKRKNYNNARAITKMAKANL